MRISLLWFIPIMLGMGTGCKKNLLSSGEDTRSPAPVTSPGPLPTPTVPVPGAESPNPPTAPGSPDTEGTAVGLEGLSFVLWVEQPTIVKQADYFPIFYGQLAGFVKSNRAGLKIHRVLLRFLNPGETSHGAAGNPWKPSATSPLITDLIANLPAKTELYALPYIDTKYPWTYRPELGIVEQAVAVVEEWNQLLDSLGSSHRLTGIVYDPEGAGIAKEDILRRTHQQLGSNPRKIKVGLTLAGRAIADVMRWGADQGELRLDEGYLQLYNLYNTCNATTNTILVDSFLGPADGSCVVEPQTGCKADPGCTDSIYLKALNQPNPAEAVFHLNSPYTFKNILTQTPMNWLQPASTIKADLADRLYPMFSLEAVVGADCIYPNTGTSICGQLNAFGSWTAADFRRFVELFHQRLGEITLAEAESIPLRNFALFQYAFIPKSWR